MRTLDEKLYGTDLFGQTINPKPSGIVAAKYGHPPFSTLDARSGEWQKRKKAWKSIGIEGELGREAVGTYSWNDLSINPRQAESTHKMAKVGDTATIFDPVLCELIYKWFCPKGGTIVDPFAGGSVRGIVAGVLGYKYWGCDLSAKQISENRKQSARIEQNQDPVWIVGDSFEEVKNAPDADLLFSCPPYGDLERYSDDQRDLSTMDWEDFKMAYRGIILRSLEKLKENRFACFVVGNFRDKNGYYNDLVSETTKAFTDFGAKLYNDAILLNSIGSASMRCDNQFKTNRKLVKVHQNVLIFCKGDWKKAVAYLAESK